MPQFTVTLDGAEYQVEAGSQDEANALASQAHSKGVDVGQSITLEDIAVTPESNPEEQDFGNRPDGTKKGNGFLGVLKRPDGGVMTEYSVGVNIDGKEIDVPTLIPTLTKDEINQILNLKEGEFPSEEIIKKASDFARRRMSQGKPVFATPEESSQLNQKNPEPSFMEKAGDVFTGNLRKTPETEQLNDWAEMPELNELTFNSFKTALGTMMTNPEETAGIIKAQYPDVQMRTDYNGNIILKSSVDGKEYAIKPGFQASDIPRSIGGIAAFTPAGRATSALGLAGASAATQGAIEGVESATGGNFDAGNVALAGGIPAASGLLSGIKNIISKATKGVPMPSVPAEALVKEAESVNIPLMTSDVSPPETFVGKGMQMAGERIPIAGTGGQRVTQQNKRLDAIQNFFDEAGLNPQVNYDVATAEELLKKRGADLTKYSQMKSDVFAGLADKGIVDTKNAVAAIDKGINDLQSYGAIVPKDAIKVLTDYKDSIAGKDIQTLEEVRKFLGAAFQSPELATVSDKTQKITNNVYRELNKDLESFIKLNGEPRDVIKWKLANQRLSALANETRNTKLKNALNDGDVTPEKINSLLFSQNESDIKTLYRNLNQQGRENAKMALIKKVYDDTFVKGKTVSPEVFINNVRKLQKQSGVIFNTEDKQKLDGLVRVLNATRRASEASVSTATGQQLYAPVAGMAVGQIADSFFTGLAGTASVGLLAKAYESKPFRDLMIKLSKVKQYSKEEDELIKKALPAIQAEKPKE